MNKLRKWFLVNVLAMSLVAMGPLGMSAAAAGTAARHAAATVPPAMFATTVSVALLSSLCATEWANYIYQQFFGTPEGLLEAFGALTNCQNQPPPCCGGF